MAAPMPSVRAVKRLGGAVVMQEPATVAMVATRRRWEEILPLREGMEGEARVLHWTHCVDPLVAQSI